MKTIHLLDYGVGNIGSLSALFDSLGYAATLTGDPATVVNSPLLVLPGVGSATTAMAELRQRNLLGALRERHQNGRSIVGICLGAQLLFGSLEESQTEGLGFLPGRVKKLPPRIRFNTGWRRLDWDRTKTNGFGVGLKESDTYFFNHQYVVPGENVPGCVTLEAEPEIPAMYFTPRLCGIQFHPEKSQMQGRILMRNVLRHYYGL